jgi:hypothetical protein
MAIDNKTSVLIEQQFPDFVYDEGENLIQFVKAYYEYMEQTGNALDANKNLLNYQDLDTTLDKFINYFYREIFTSVPKTLMVDDKLFLKHVRDLYLSKGTEESFQLLFRILFNEEISFYNPGDDILRASDGRWYETTKLRLTPIAGTITNIDGYTIKGLTSGAIARAQTVNYNLVNGLDFYDITISNVLGTFVDGETIENTDKTITAKIDNTVGQLKTVTIVTGGSGHIVGDKIDIEGLIGSGSTGVVTAISNTSAIDFSVSNGGDGYRISYVDTNNPTGDPILGSASVVGGPGTGAGFLVTSIVPSGNVALQTDIIEYLANVAINTDPSFGAYGNVSPLISIELYTSNVDSLMSDALPTANSLYGVINTIATFSTGGGYTSLPTVEVIDAEATAVLGPPLGENAVITPAYVDGSIAAATVDEKIITTYNTSNRYTLINRSRANTYNATATGNVTGVIDIKGRYIDTRGWLSSNKKLQDNYFYQEFSYEITSNQVINSYRKLLLKLLHPAGNILFGRKQFDTSITLSTVTVEANVESIAV